jgi:hypothetical protein
MPVRKGEMGLAQATEPASNHPARRREAPWWLQPTYTVVALGLFSLYAIWEAFFHNTGRYENYLSPFFSPDVRTIGIRVLPALFVLWVPLLFRGTCYYYRKSIYRSFLWDPPACAIPERTGRRYNGETRFPFNLMNLHRFFLYLAIIVLIFLWKDAIDAFFFPKTGFGVGVGSLLMLLNVVLLSLYTFSCHAFRHLVGGNLNCFSCERNPRTRYRLWRIVSNWNRNHSVWAWVSMFSVWATDLYIRLLIMGVIHDVRLF